MLFQMHQSMLGEAIRKVLKVEGGLYHVVSRVLGSVGPSAQPNQAGE